MSQIHSETLVVIGAGATAALGMPSSNQQTNIFRALVDKEKTHDSTLSQYFSSPDLAKVGSFLKLLDCSNKDFYEITEEDIECAKCIYNSKKESLLRKRIHELRQDYDWDAAKKIIKICPEKNETSDNLIRDLYSIIDGKLLNHQSLKVMANGSEEILNESRLQGARNFITLFINMLFASNWHKIVNGDKDEIFQKYKKFINAFDRLMQKEGDVLSKNFDFSERGFYLFTTSFVSFNFEMVFPWLFMNSHRELNHQGTFLKERKQYLWLDYGVEHRSRKSKDGKIVPTLEFTEAVASRVNEMDHAGDELNRCGKFYFAHGSSNWRECPVCGRMTFYTGNSKNKWDYKSKNLIPSFPIPLFDSEKENDFTEKENQWKNNLKYDSLECMHCGAETKAYDAPMIMQTLYKSTPTSFIEEIQRNVKVSLDKARHIVLLGYSLPPDDTIWQQAFSEAVRSKANTGIPTYCSVVGIGGEQKWLYGDELDSLCEKNPAVKSAIAIFGKENVRAWTGGIPQVFKNSSEQNIKELLYPKFVNWEGTRVGLLYRK